MTIVNRVSEVTKSLAHLSFETVAIGTETLRVLATHLDNAVDELAKKTE